MSSTIDRVHFYERQYLRAFDLEAEQLYHIEMRRRLNISLHTWGIVDGLDLRESETVPGIPREFYISRGMAIDAYGRELIVPVDTPITDADLDRNRIQTETEFFLSIAYRRELTTPPSGGYQLCDIKDQYTRWHESFEVLITKDDPTANLGSEPTVADPLSDDPSLQPWPIVLGKITTKRPVGGRLTVDNAPVAARRYAGVRAQQLVTPSTSVTSDPGEAARPLIVEADLLAHKNLYVGENFELTNVSGKPIVDPTKEKPPATGVTKIQKDLFLQGEFYANVGGEWLKLKDYLQSFIPEIQVGRTIVPVVPSSTSDTTKDTAQIVVTLKRLRKPQERVISVAIASITWQNRTEETAWAADAADNGSRIKLVVKEPKPAQELATNKYQFDVEWEVEPTSNTVPNHTRIREFTLSWVAVFTP
jgi:hypothetical protein